jgi:hypothetical protein
MGRLSLAVAHRALVAGYESMLSPNPSLERGPPPAWHLARKVFAVYHSLRGPSATPVPAPQLKRWSA